MFYSTAATQRFATTRARNLLYFTNKQTALRDRVCVYACVCGARLFVSAVPRYDVQRVYVCVLFNHLPLSFGS